MRKSVVHKIYQYTAVFEPDARGRGFTVTIPSLPGCISEGDSLEAAKNNITEAMQLYLEVYMEKHAQPPIGLAIRVT